MIHELKCWPEYFSAIHSRLKMCELRKDDRDYKVGHDLRLREWDNETNSYTGRETVRTITHILRHAEQFGLMPGYCILSMA